MNSGIKSIFGAIFRFFSSKSRRRLIFLTVLGLYALAQFLYLGQVRRTFIFYSIKGKENGSRVIIENRSIKRSTSKEASVRRYVEEALLGPVTPDAMPLFPANTKLNSMYYSQSEGTVYINFTKEAELPPEEGVGAFTNFYSLYSGIRRNFQYIKDVRFFIAGKEAFSGKFENLFSMDIFK